MTTNANSSTLAALISDSTRCARFASLVQTLKGVVRLAPGEKRGGRKITCGDHTVRDTFVSGGNYGNLTRKSLAEAIALWVDAVTYDPTTGLVDTISFKGGAIAALVAEGRQGWTGRGKNAVQVTLTTADYEAALTEQINSFVKTLAGTNESTTDHVYESLVVDGEKIRGYRVYVGPTDPKAAPAATPGTIYLQGLLVGRKVITKAQHDKPAGKSGAKSVAKKHLRSFLPVRRYVSYCLQPGSDFILNLGSDAVSASDAAGITVDPTAVASALALVAA